MRRSSAVNVVPDGSTAADRTAYPYPTMPVPPPSPSASDRHDSRDKTSGKRDRRRRRRRCSLLLCMFLVGDLKRRIRRRSRSRERKCGTSFDFFRPPRRTSHTSHLPFPRPHQIPRRGTRKMTRRTWPLGVKCGPARLEISKFRGRPTRSSRACCFHFFDFRRKTRADAHLSLRTSRANRERGTSVIDERNQRKCQNFTI